MKTQAVVCAQCGITFEKSIHEVRRTIERGKKHYHNLGCAAKANMEHLKPYQGQGNIAGFAGNRKDQYSGYREFLRRIKRRQGDTNVTLEYLKQLWDRQSGICPYSGIALILPIGKRQHDPIRTASLDRKDSGKGYEIGNLQYVSTCINWMKNSMTHEQTLEVIDLVRRSGE